MKIVDLHVHSTCSDGTYTPTELVHYALQKGLAAFALTDHDTTEGLIEAIEAARNYPIEVIPGIEFSTEYEGKDIHIVGLYIDYEHEEFQKYIKDFQDSRELRNQKMCLKLQEHGIAITYEELSREYPNAILTRAHFAKFLLKKGYVQSMREAFDRYIGDHAPCFLPREKITPSQAVSFILRFGGIPILAHPILYHMSTERLDKLVQTLKKSGLVAIEAVYSTYTAGEERQIRKLAKKYNLLISGGSDFHGSTKPGLDLAVGYGKLQIPYQILADIKAYRNLHGSILFSDMDGTLLNDQKEITSATYEALEAFWAKGGKLVLSSGRPLGSILEVADKLHLARRGTYIIAFNGALIYDCDQKQAIYEVTIPCPLVKTISEVAQKHGVYTHTYDTDDNGSELIITEKDGEELTFYRQNIHLPYTVVPDMSEALHKDPYKMIAIHLCSNHDALDAFSRELSYLIGDKIHTFYSGAYYMECCMKDASKGDAVRFLCDYLDIPIDEAVACGDAANDISMIEAAGIGVAMQNATDDVKLKANYITANNNNSDGIKEVLERFLL
jgi:Cof subfamily protein (haloacid dehalogenase superfamily)